MNTTSAFGHKCVQANVNHCEDNQFTLINDLIEKPNVNIICLTEPYIPVNGTSLPMPGDGFTSFIPGKGARVAVLTRNMVSFPVKEFCSQDVMTIQMQIGPRVTYLVALYLDGKILQIPKVLIDLLERRLINKNTDIIICSDSNSHSTLWGCDKTSARGRMVEDLCLKYGLFVLNVGNKPTFENSRGYKSIIDLTISNVPFNLKIKNWRVEDELYSDHRNISF